MAKPMRHASPAEVRAWARRKKLKVGSRGRIDADIIAAFNAEMEGDRIYRDTTNVKIDAEELVELAKRFIQPAIAIQSVLELADELNDPAGDSYHPDVARKIKSRIGDQLVDA